MALLDILHFPDKRLRIRAKPVKLITDETRQQVADMFETMYHAPGIGLAANQVNINQRIIVVDVSDNKVAALALINPEITHKDGIEQSNEGCLSVPSVLETVERASKITVTALNLDAKQVNIEADGLLAICIQHEIDHLNGRLFIDYLSDLKRQRIHKKLKKTNGRKKTKLSVAL